MKTYMRRLPIICSTLGLLWACLVCAGMAHAQQSLQLVCSTNQVGKFEKIEFGLTVPGNFVNPFDPEEVEVSLHLTSPAGQALTIPAFYGQAYERRLVGQRDWMYPKGMPTWQGRFAPVELGKYKVSAVLRSRSGSSSSKPVEFECIPSRNKGFVRVSKQDPRFLEFSEGQPFFPIGQNLAFIGDQQFVSLTRAGQIFGKLSTNGANYLRIWACCVDWAMAVEARKSAWGRSWDWRPPLARVPGEANTNRQCLQLTSQKASLSVNPSHNVALRPLTQYVVSGKVITEAGAGIRVAVHGTRSVAVSSKSADTWTEFRHEFQTGPNDYWMDRMSVQLEGGGTAWVEDLSLREASGGPELLWEAQLNRPVRGYYNPLDCYMLDEVVAEAEKHGIYLQICLLTRDLYMKALKNPSSPEYAQAVADAKKTFRYAVGRWGYSTSVAAWEYWNEMDPGLPTDAFYTALGEHLEQIDVYHHLRTTSTWGPSAKDCRHPKLDFADTHFYLRPADKGRLRDEVDAVQDRTRWLRQQAPNKPAHLGEIGLANDKWQPTEEMKQSQELVDFHNILWASALSGSTGTGLFWWWDRLDPRDAYPMYRPVSAFVADVPWTSGEINKAELTVSGAQLQAMGLRAKNRAWVWLFNPAASWGQVVIAKKTPAEISGAEVDLPSWPAGNYTIQWWDTWEGKLIAEQKQAVENGTLHLKPPAFARDIACKILQ